MMTVRLSFAGNNYEAQLNNGYDLSIPLIEGIETVNAWWAPYVEAVPVRMGTFVGSVAEGGSVNFKTVKFNPHGNGTHTECVGHISKERYVIREALTEFHHVGLVVSVFPERWENGDRVITKSRLLAAIGDQKVPPALVIRTLPNDELKLKTNYSGANPPYLEASAAEWMVEQGVDHLLLDLPSVDRESDGGALAAHKAFWTYPEKPRTKATITELIFVNDLVKDGYYLVNLQTASFDLDASPSKPVLYPLQLIELKK